MSARDADLAATFRARARAEADRYGTDPWVLVRELLQNARDAGARAVRVEAVTVGGVERLAVRDDGDGVGFDDARRFLFTLYASSKGGRDEAGRFGVGFWSVLRFEPERIVVRSWPRRDPPWELVLDGRLEVVQRGRPEGAGAGFEVVLERPARGQDLPARVREAIRRDAPRLRQRGGRQRPLELTVNGRSAAVPLELDPPSLHFYRRRLEGAVALGREPRVDLHALGLRVRTAASLDDLLLRSEGRPRPAPGGAAGRGLAPRVVLDCDRLEPLLARGDARDSRELQRVVAVARRELRRLVRRQLDRWAPRAWPLRLLDRWAPPRRVGWWGAAVTALALVVAGATLLRPWPRPAVTAGASAPVPYVDLAADYRGPTVEGLAAGGAVDLTFRPAEPPLLVAALVVGGLAADGAAPPPQGPAAPYPVEPCADDCVELEVGFAAPSRWLRLPLPTGHRLDATSVAVDGRPGRVWTTTSGEALVELESAGVGRVRYRTGPGPAPAVTRGGWPPLPPPLAAEAAALGTLDEAERVKAATALVRSRVVYDSSPAAAVRHREASRLGLDFVRRALVVGTGDCDVQNALLAAVLDRAGLGARLAVGYVGVDGRATPGLHAWVEVAVAGRLLVADASAVDAGSPAGAVAPVGMVAGGAIGRVGPPHGAPRAGGGTRAWVLGGAVALVALLVAGRAARDGLGRWSRLRLADGEGLADLLEGALERPEAFAPLGEVARRPLVPLVGGGRVSLARARRLAGRALYRGRGGEPLAERAARRGVVVLDAATPEGRLVGGAFGAVDLEWWQRLLERSETLEVRCGRQRLQVRVAEGVGEPLRSLEAPRLGMDLVVLDRSSPLARRLVDLLPGRPALAALLVADAVAHHRELAPGRRGALLAGLARAAVREEAGG